MTELTRTQAEPSRHERSSEAEEIHGVAPWAASIAELAGSLGLKPQALRVLSEKRGKSVIHLSPEPVVARVVALNDFGARDVAQLEAQVSVARYLADSGQPVVPLAAVHNPGPHPSAGYYATFWAFVPRARTLGDAGRDAGIALRMIHLALHRYPGELSSVFEVIRGRVDRSTDRLSRGHGNRLRRSAKQVWASVGSADWAMQPLHGDAHLGNVLRTRSGIAWNDLEHVCRGPVEWDLACLAVTAAALGHDRKSTAQALSGYGSFDVAAVDRLIDLRVLEFAALKAFDGSGDDRGLDAWLSVLDVRLADRRSALCELQSLAQPIRTPSPDRTGSAVREKL